MVTREGKIFTYKKTLKTWREQKCRKHSNGYIRAIINGKDEYVHRLVAKYFVPNPNGYLEVNHIDGNKENNCADNLEWCTRSQNNKHAFQTGLRSYSDLSRMAKMPKLKMRKFTDDAIRDIRNSDLTDTELAKKYGVARGAIYNIRQMRSYKEVV